MATPSNLYAEKIFSEHPIGLWTFDDKADYVSLITEAERDLTSWSITGGTVSVDSSITSMPFQGSIVNRIVGNIPSTATNEIVLTSGDLYNFSNMNSNYGTFCISSYIYIDSAFTESISIGYEYTDLSSSTIIEKIITKNVDVLDEWVHISATFDILNENANIRPIIKIKTVSGGVVSTDYHFFVNGITVGQWSEEFNQSSLGVESINFPATIALNQAKCIEAKAYGVASDPAYYLVSDGALTAKNTSVPMVYGASGITKLIPNNNKPSIIFPGKGFLNKVGQYNDYTVEFWARINSDTKTPKRIFGPIASSDGLYVESGFLTLVIGKQFISHFVGEWFRPMLIDIRLIRNFASVLINGEQVMAMTIDTASLVLPEEYNEDDENQDWLGIYAYDDVSPIEIDCVTIYSYQVSSTLAKRRFIYGQAVSSPEGINSAYSGTTAFIDYSFADYTSNYAYPNLAQWNQGSIDNLSAGDLTLSTPSYSLPEIFLSNKNLSDLYDDNKSIQVSGQDKFITFRPNSSWNAENCYFNFTQFNILGIPTDTFYGVFSSTNLASTEILFKVYNSITSDYFTILKDEDKIKYVLNYNGASYELYESISISSGEKFAAGIKIDDFTSYFGGDSSAFFGMQNALRMYVGGDETGSSQFTGKIYCVSLCTEYNSSLISSYINSEGVCEVDDLSAPGSETVSANALLSNIASYTLLPLEAYETYFLDIGVSGHWEDYMPLSYFGQFVNNQQGQSYYDLDFLQFNIGYPAPSSLKELEQTSSWTYGELKNTYQHPVVKSYSQLDNALLTGWNNYTDLLQKSIKYYEYDTADASIKSYVTFQYVEDGANLINSNFSVTQPAKESGIIDLSEYSGWQNTKFNVIDNMIIYPRKDIDFNDLAIVYRLDFNVRGILTKPLSLRKLEIASQAFNDNLFNPVGTKFGVNLFPYTRAGLYFDYKAKNPFSIYKGNTPYLYLNRTSGIQVRGDFDPLVSRGISMPINSGLAPEYSVSAIQMWLRYDKNLFPGSQQEVFEFKYAEDTIKFYIVANSENGNRAKILAKSQNTGQEYTALTYYINGIEVNNPIITTKEWVVFGIRFDTSLSFNSFLGAINLTGPIVFNNITYYQANNLQRVQSTKERPWADIKVDYTTDPDTNLVWSDWWGPNTGDSKLSWSGVLISGSVDFYGVNPSIVYKTYLGTNKIILDDNEGVEFLDDKISIYSDVVWLTSDIVPV